MFHAQTIHQWHGSGGFLDRQKVFLLSFVLLSVSPSLQLLPYWISVKEFVKILLMSHSGGDGHRPTDPAAHGSPPSQSSLAQSRQLKVEELRIVRDPADHDNRGGMAASPTTPGSGSEGAWSPLPVLGHRRPHSPRGTDTPLEKHLSPLSSSNPSSPGTEAFRSGDIHPSPAGSTTTDTTSVGGGMTAPSDQTVSSISPAAASQLPTVTMIGPERGK